MADQLINSAPTSTSTSSPFSILNNLPTKRIDAAIAEAAQTGVPEQGKQTGGYAPNYAHLSYLPLLPLYSQAQHDLLAKTQSHKERQIKQMDATDPDKLLTGGQKTFLGVVGHLSGGGAIVSTKRWERRLVGANVMSTNLRMEQNKLVVFTRWTVPGPTALGTEWFVDVLEHRMLDPTSRLGKWGGNYVGLKAGFVPSGAKKESKVTFKLVKTDTKQLKSQKVWTKLMNRELCEAVTFVGEDGKNAAMEIVARIQRACSTIEVAELQKRFEKEWVVPVL